MKLVDKVLKIIENEKLIEKDDNVLIGISGGIDSTVMVDILFEISRKIKFKIALAHLNHQLRGEESTRDEKFTKDLAEKYSLQLHAGKTNVKEYAKNRGISLQHAGRDLRYAFFNELSGAYDFNKIAVAHNCDDQIETFMLRIIKGTGIRGLLSIPIKRGKIIRPFLNVYRYEIDEYAENSSIEYVKDSSNDKIVYERNYIRKEIVPLFEKMNPAFKEKVIFLLRDLTAVNILYDNNAQEFINKQEKIQNNDISYEIEALKSIDEETRFRVIANTFAKIEPDFIPLREHSRLIENILTSEKPNLILAMPRGIRVKKIYKKIIFTKKHFLPDIVDVFPINTGNNLLEPLSLQVNVSLFLNNMKINYHADNNRYIAYFDADKTGNMTVRTFLNGDRFIPLGMNNAVKLKDFFISQKIPGEERRRIPLLVSGDDIIWIIGYRIDQRYRISENTKNILKVSIKKVHEI